MDFLIVSAEQVMNFELQIDQTMMNQVKISRLFQLDFAYHCLAWDYV